MPGSEKEREVAGVGFKIQTFSSLSRAFKASLLMFLNATYNDWVIGLSEEQDQSL